MQAPQYKFLGYLPIKISRKGSIRMPQKWSNCLTGRYFLELYREGDFSCIQLFSEEILLAKTAEDAEVEANDDREPFGASQHERREVPLNSLPNLILPLDWCKAAGIETPGEVILAGRGNFLVFWKPTRFHDRISLEQGQEP